MRRLLLLLPLALLGCGGGGSSAPAPAKGGRATLSVLWPARARLIPNAANCLVVTLRKDGAPVAETRIARPTSGGQTQTAFDHLPYGDLAVSIEARPNADGTGVAQAKGAGTMAVGEDVPGRVTVALDSTVASLAVEPAAPVVATDGTRTLTASAKDADGNVVLLAAGGGEEALTWTSGNPAAARIEGTGSTATLTGVAAGTTEVNATLRVKDNGATLSASITAEAKAPTLALSLPTEVTFGTITPSGRGSADRLKTVFLNIGVSPTRSAVTSVALSASGPLSVPATTSVAANTATVSAIASMQHVAAPTPATVVAAAPFGSDSKTILIKPNPLASVSGPASVQGGTTVTGTVTLELYALASETVALSCSDPAMTLPLSAVVPQPTFTSGMLGGGFQAYKTKTFSIATSAVSSARTVTIVATCGGVTKSFDLTITP